MSEKNKTLPNNLFEKLFPTEKNITAKENDRSVLTAMNAPLVAHDVMLEVGIDKPLPHVDLDVRDFQQAGNYLKSVQETEWISLSGTSNEWPYTTTPSGYYEYYDAWGQLHYSDKADFSVEWTSASWPENRYKHQFFQNPTVFTKDFVMKKVYKEEASTGISDAVVNPVDKTEKEPSEFEYTFNEEFYINEALDHITKTYSQHYAGGKYQATDLIIDKGHGTGFNVGNAIKYLCRYGKKDGYNRKDLLKAIHYIIMQLYVHDLEHLNNIDKE